MCVDLGACKCIYSFMCVMWEPVYICVHFCMWCREEAGGMGGVCVRGGGVALLGLAILSVAWCSTVQGLNAGVIKEQLQGCMDTRQSRPNEVSIGRIGAHAWTKASWHSFRAGPLQGEQTHTHSYTAHTHTAHITKAGWWQYKRLNGTQF